MFDVRMARSIQSKPKLRLTVRPITSDDWPIIEKLFGANGACGGCWCMVWRLPRGGKLWEEQKGVKNKRSFKKLVTSGHATGCLAFDEDQPVGWCSVGPRADFARLAGIKALQTEWTERTWSITCFYIPTKRRHQGVASALLKGAVKLARDSGATAVEGYPVRPSKSFGGEIPAAFAWTGVAELFVKQKFQNITPRGNSRDIFKKTLRPRRK